MHNYRIKSSLENEVASPNIDGAPGDNTGSMVWEEIHLLHPLQHHAYKDVQEAKTACDQDDSCGGVGLDKIPYREAPGAPPKYAHTIYLMGVDKVEEGSWRNYRYTSYVKC